VAYSSGQRPAIRCVCDHERLERAWTLSPGARWNRIKRHHEGCWLVFGRAAVGQPVPGCPPHSGVWSALDYLQGTILIMRVRLYAGGLFGDPIFRNHKIVVRLQIDPIAVARAEVG
jgi:hypothetical protein